MFSAAVARPPRILLLWVAAMALTRNDKMDHVSALPGSTVTLLSGVPGLRIVVVGYRVMQPDNFGWFADAIAPLAAVGPTQVALGGANSTGYSSSGDGEAMFKLPPGRSMVYNNTFGVGQAEVHFTWHWEAS